MNSRALEYVSKRRSPLPCHCSREGGRVPKIRAYGAQTCLISIRRDLAASILQSTASNGGKVAECVAQVKRGQQALLSSRDMTQLRSAFEQAAIRYGGAVAPVSRPSSPWGLPIRKPRKAADQAVSASSPLPAAQPLAGATPDIPTAAAASNPQHWDWSSVQRLVVYGSGSLGACLNPKGSTASGSGQPGGRLGQRLLQLALVALLQEELLPGLTSPPQLFDPEFDQFDREVLQQLGWQEGVAGEEGDGPCYVAEMASLVYMPCCPRQMYNQLLSANQSQGALPRLALLGTSFKSLQDSTLLFQKLTTTSTTSSSSSGLSGPSGSGSKPGLTGRRTGDVSLAGRAAAGGAANAQLGALSQDGQVPSSVRGLSAAAAPSAQDVEKQQQQQPPHDAVTTAAAGEGAPELAGQLSATGAVVEVFCPDMAAHGIGTSIHLFPQTS